MTDDEFNRQQKRVLTYSKLRGKKTQLEEDLRRLNSGSLRVEVWVAAQGWTRIGLDTVGLKELFSSRIVTMIEAYETEMEKL